ncbi:MAG: hypothetical protein IKX96_00705, partial [Firmicutes bacterium]|nr:hypothetical protein [Bacillota bacterium]
PFVAGKVKGIYSDINEACLGADLIILGVNHKQYKNLDFEGLAKIVRTKNFFDTRNFCDANAAKAAGFSCELLGKQNK